MMIMIKKKIPFNIFQPKSIWVIDIRCDPSLKLPVIFKTSDASSFSISCLTGRANGMVGGRSRSDGLISQIQITLMKTVT